MTRLEKFGREIADLYLFLERLQSNDRGDALLTETPDDHGLLVDHFWSHAMHGRKTSRERTRLRRGYTRKVGKGLKNSSSSTPTRPAPPHPHTPARAPVAARCRGR